MALQAFFDFLHNRQPPRPLSEITTDDAIGFLLTQPSNKIEAVVDELSAATLKDLDGSHVYNPFSSEIVRTFVQERVDKKEDLFEKCLTTDSLNRLLVTGNEDTGKYLSLGTGSLLRFEDEEGKPWLFEVAYLNTSQCYEFTNGWSSYVKEKQLNAGDYVFFKRNRTETSKLFISFRRRDNDGEQQDDLQLVTSSETLELREKLKDGLQLPEHSIKGFAPILVIYCGDNQDSEETYLISLIISELCLCGFEPMRYDLTSSKVTENQEMLTKSQVGIIIFSDNYTRSSQCKNGFTEIIDHFKANNHMTIPVYYKVSLLDVEGPSSSFEKASTPLETSLKWMAAMLKSISINRYLYMNGGSVMLVKNIVKDVFSLLSSETNRKPLGMRNHLNNILSLLQFSQSSVPHIVGLWGMAGIGKTTISREIFRIEGKRHDVCYFLPDFHKMCQTKGLSHLRDEFFSKIFGEEDVFIDSCDIKLSFLKDKFLDKRVLIVLDGVSNARDAEVLVGGFGWFSAGHTIILTSRNRQVLIESNAKRLYKIPKLSKSQSIEVCSHYATYPNMKLISELVKYASGIPLALQVLGSSVNSNNEKDHLTRLRQHPPIEIQDAFRRSFNGLDDNEKNIFLDIACFFRGESKDHVVNILDACGFLTYLGICGLIDESLISLVDNKFEMPNIFKDMGRFVVCQEQEEAGKRSRLYDSNDIVDVLTYNLGTEAIEGMFFDVSGLTFELSSKVFDRMYRLRLLKIHSRKICLPHGLHTLPDELRLLHWEIYPLGSLPRSFNPKNLVELNMPYSNMTKLWKGTKSLENLKRVILSHSRQLTKFPRLSKARNLEHIDLEGCTSLVKVNSSILQLHKLTFLNLKDCSHLQIMPTTADLESLEVLNLSGCSQLKDFHGFSPNLKELYLAGTAISVVPSSVRDLTRLVKFDLEDCNKLLDLPSEISNLKIVATLPAKSPASSMNSRNISSVEDMPPPHKRWRLKKVIESVILSLRKRKGDKSAYRATNQVQLSSASTSVNDHSYKSFYGFQVLPERTGQPECLYYMKTGDCKYGYVCKFHHPKDRETRVPGSFLKPSRLGKRPTSSMDSRNLSSVEDMAPTYKRYRLKRVIESVILNLRKRKREQNVYRSPNQVLISSAPNSAYYHSYKSLSGFQVLPERPGQPECQYYMKTGNCKFGKACNFHHPKDRETHVPESFLNPSRPGQPLFFVYSRTGNCSSGPTCILDHPTFLSTEKNTSSVASKTPPMKLPGFSLAFGAPPSEVVETSTTSMAFEAPTPINPLGLSLTLGPPSSELVETSTKKPRIYKNTTSMASEAPTPINPLGLSLLLGPPSSELLETPTKKPRIHKNTTSRATELPNPLGISSYSLGASSSDLMETSTLSGITQATSGRDIIDLMYEDEKPEMDDFVLVHPWDLNLL